jgi:hypothetical protein
MQKIIIEIVKAVLFSFVGAVVKASRTVIFGRISTQEQKLKDKATKDGWNKENTKLCLLLPLFFVSGCMPAAIVLQNGQSVMLAKNRKAKCFVLAEDGSRYLTTVDLKSGWICGPVDFEK